MKKIIDKIKNISFKTFMIVIIIATIVIFVIALILHFENKHKEYMLDTMYDVYPSNVKELYRYLVDANCTGDIKFNLELDSDSVLVNNLDKVDLMDYLFNYLEKRGYLQDSIDIKNINEAIDLLFIDKIDLLKGMESYDYDGYTYMFKDNKVTRKVNKCNNDIKYISHLYGYSNKEETLWLDINMGYLKNDILYDLKDKELGKFDNNKEELFKDSTYYYRVYYIKDKGEYKLNKVKLVSKSF